VWTYDIYGAFLNKKATDRHYVAMGRWSTLIGVLVSVGTAYLVQHAASIMDYVQQLFSFFIAPLFGTVILGMLWKRTTPAAGFWGLLAGILTSFALWAWVKIDPSALRHVAFSSDAKDMAENVYRAMWCLIANVVVTVVVSLFTKAKPEHELKGLVYGLTEVASEGQFPFFRRPITWAAAVAVGFVLLNLLFW
jgi:SSS family solute:Na+ symporter